MFFIALTFAAAFLIEGLGTLVSVIGLSSLFGSNLIIIALAISLDLGKIVVVSLLYTYWNKLGAIMKSYALVAAIVTMTITSAGAAGYLTGKFQEAILGSQESSIRLNALLDEQKQLTERKQQIDAQIAAIPDRYTAAQKIRLMNQFKAEQTIVNKRINEITAQVPELKVADISKQAKAGPIILLAKSFNVTIEEAILWVVMMIIFVFDPLAVFLIVAGNFLVAQRKKNEEVAKEVAKEVVIEPTDAPLIEDDAAVIPRAEAIIQPMIIEEKPQVDLELVPIEEKEEPIQEEVISEIQKVKKPRKPRAPKKLKLVPIVEELQIEEEPVKETVSKRPEIKLTDLIHKGPRPASILDDVTPDNSVKFDETPDANLASFYKDQKPTSSN
jgi:hypothetical protein